MTYLQEDLGLSHLPVIVSAKDSLSNSLAGPSQVLLNENNHQFGVLKRVFTATTESYGNINFRTRRLSYVVVLMLYCIFNSARAFNNGHYHKPALEKSGYKINI